MPATKIIICFIGSLILLSAGAQVNNIKIKKEKEPTPKPQKRYEYASIDIYYGNKIYTNSFYNQLNHNGHVNASAPVKAVGIGVSGYEFLIGAGGITIQTSYNYYIKSRIRIDSLPTDVQGFAYTLGFGRIFHTRNKRLSLAIYLGFNTGRLKLKYSDGSSFKNNFSAPRLCLQPKFMLTPKLSVSVMVDYDYDLSPSAWKPIRTVNLPPPASFKQSGLTALLSVGYYIW